MSSAAIASRIIAEKDAEIARLTQERNDALESARRADESWQAAQAKLDEAVEARGEREHDAYVDCLNGGYKGYQAACWDCDWRGPEHLRGDEEMDTPESRSHKMLARGEAADHHRSAQPIRDVCRSCGGRITPPILDRIRGSE